MKKSKEQIISEFGRELAQAYMKPAIDMTPEGVAMRLQALKSADVEVRAMAATLENFKKQFDDLRAEETLGSLESKYDVLVMVYDTSKALYQAKFMLQQISLLISEAKEEVK